MKRIGVAQWCLDRQGVAAVYRALELGVAVIQIDAGGSKGNPPLHEKAIQHAYLQALRETGMAITGIAVSVINDFELQSTVDSSALQKRWKAIRQAIEAAASMNVGLVMLPSFRSSEIRGEKDLLRTAAVLKKACAYALDYQVLIATENSLSARDNKHLLQVVDYPNLRILIDTLNPTLWGHNVSELIEAVQPYICDQVHVKDGRDGIMGNCPLNEGQAGLAATMETLRRIQFTGDLILENRYQVNAEKRITHDLTVVSSFMG